MDSEREKYLIEKVKEGNHELFSFLISEYQDKLFAFVFRMIYHHEDAEDITQESFLKAYRSLKSFRFQSKFSTWLFQIAYNTAVNFIRRSRKKRDIENRLRLPVVYDRQVGDLEKKELSEIIEGLLSSLKENYCAPLHLFYKEEKSYAEIAEIMNIPVNTVKSNIFRGKEQLKEMLLKQYAIDELL